MNDRILGVYPTMVTPYHSDGSIDYGAVRAMTEWYYEKGCDGIFAACQSSEIFELSGDERVSLVKTVKDAADSLARQNPARAPMQIVASGHISYAKEAQREELSAVADAGADAIILISNRMDIPNRSDDAWIADTEYLMNALPDNVPLGVYECPRPYKRLLSDKMLKFCARSGRFRFMKDTCCDAAVIARRVKLLEGTPMRLLNANGQTLLASLRSGGAGYCGVMANFHPELFVWLCRNFEKEPEKANLLQSFLGTAAFTESLAYPVTAKYHLKEIEGLPLTSLYTRVRPASDIKDYDRDCVRQMETLAEYFLALMKGGSDR